MLIHLYYFYLVVRNNFANINLLKQQLELQIHTNMINYFNRNLAKSVCIENIPNFFWTFL